MPLEFQPSHHEELTPLLQPSQEPEVNANKSSLYVRESNEAFYLKVALMLSAGIALVLVGILANKIAHDIKSPPSAALLGVVNTIGLLSVAAGVCLAYKGINRAERGPGMVKNKQYEPPPPEPLKYDEINRQWVQTKNLRLDADQANQDEKAFLFAERQSVLGALKLYMEEPTNPIYKAEADFQMDKLAKNPKIFDSEPRVVSGAELLATFKNVKKPQQLKPQDVRTRLPKEEAQPKETESAKPYSFDYDDLGGIDVGEQIEMQDLGKIDASKSLKSLIRTFEDLKDKMTNQRIQEAYQRQQLVRSISVQPEVRQTSIDRLDASIKLLDSKLSNLNEIIEELQTNPHANLQEIDNILDRILENVGEVGYAAVSNKWYSWRLDTLLEEVTKSAKEMPDRAMSKWKDAKALADRYQIPNAREKLAAAKEEIPTQSTDWWRQPGEL